MQLLQYWDTGDPPAEVAAWIRQLKADNPEFDHRLLDRRAGMAFIAAHYGPREVSAFEACAVPAMQADYLRLCVIKALGGLYVDADFRSMAPLSSLFKDDPALMLTWNGHVVTGLLLFREPGDPFIAACLQLATENIEARRFDNVYNCTGPGIVNAIRCLIDPAALDQVLVGYNNPRGRTWGFPELLEAARASVPITAQVAEAFSRIRLRHILQVARWLDAPKPAYKSTSVHWLDWSGSIFR